MYKGIKYWLISILLMAFMGLNTYSQYWPQWRGPDANGIAAPGDYPVEFSPEDDLLWKVELPGKGGSTPIVWEDRLFITSGIGVKEEGEDGVLCFDLNGNLLWQTKLGRQKPGKHPRGSGSAPSAVCDGSRVFVFFKSSTLAALDLDGNILWKTKLEEDYGEISYFWDMGSSPVLADGKVIIPVMHEGDSYILALDQVSGEEAWKADRNYKCNVESAQSYTTPIVRKKGEATRIIVWGADHLTEHKAETGEKIWECGGFNPDNQRYWRTIASAILYNDIVVVPYGRGRLLRGVRIGGIGDISDKAVLWEKDRIGTDVATPLAINGRVYILGFGGKIWCLDIESGEELWEFQLPGVNGMFYSSPTLAGNKLYMISENGVFFVCEIGASGLEILHQTTFEDNFVATPVLLDDKIFLRGNRYLYCIGK
jgi:outer membrane protein assembly factor BamB